MDHRECLCSSPVMKLSKLWPTNVKDGDATTGKPRPVRRLPQPLLAKPADDDTDEDDAHVAAAPAVAEAAAVAACNDAAASAGSHLLEA